jgi:hypothetical protein
MMTVSTLGVLNSVLLELKEYMRASYPDTPLSEFKEVDTYVCDHGGVDTLDDDEDHE